MLIKKLLPGLLTLFFLVLTIYGIFSFSLTDPNLVIISWQPYWQFQQWMWHTFFANHVLLSEVFTIIVSTLFLLYFEIVHVVPKTNKKKMVIVYALFLLPLFFSYNALSHDVFNYMFNAKVILVYHKDLQKTMPYQFEPDPWLRFMNNTDAYAPYGRAWTLISLVPFLVGLGKFVTTWLAFRAYSVISIALLYGTIMYIARRLKDDEAIKPKNLALLFLNPLFLIEVVSNSHNDVWLMFPAVLALGLMISRKKIADIILSVAVLLFSVFIKYSSLLLFPLWIYFFLHTMIDRFFPKKEVSWIHTHWATLASLSFFVLLLTDRSQQFQPWYLTWCLVWLPFIRLKFWRNILLIFSVSSLLRYIPWMWNGGYTDIVVPLQRVITWLPPFIGAFVMLPTWWHEHKKQI